MISFVTEKRTVPNQQPLKDSPYRIALIGEAPGDDETNHRLPFVGISGKFLSTCLREAGIDRTSLPCR